jgi:hypothetical protein
MHGNVGKWRVLPRQEVVTSFNYFSISSSITCNKLFLVTERAFAGDHLEILMKAGEIVETAFIAQLLNADIIFYQQPAGMAHPYFNQELGIGLARAGFEISAERIGADTGHLGNLIQLNGPFEILEAVIVYYINTIILRFKAVLLKANGGEYQRLFAFGDHGQGVH